jgi:hypothetical protein
LEVHFNKAVVVGGLPVCIFTLCGRQPPFFQFCQMCRQNFEGTYFNEIFTSI